MYEISDERPLPGSHSVRDGLTNTLREMHKGESIEVPQLKKSSVYSAAKLAGIKVSVRDTGKGTAIVWCVDGPERVSIFTDSLDIFGDPLPKTSNTN